MGQPRETGNAGSQSSKTNLELLNEIDEMLDGPDAELDLDAVREDLKALQKRAPIEQVRSKQESWDELMKSVNADEQDAEQNNKPRKAHRKVKFLRVLEVAVILILVLAISASAFNFNPFHPFLQAVRDLVQSASNPSGNLELSETIDAEYHSFREALDANGAADAQCLTWIPLSYSFANADVQSTKYMIKMTGYYSSPEKELIFNVVKYKAEDYVGSMERNEDISYETMIVNSQEYQWTNNLDIVSVWWNDSKYYYTLYGALTEREMETIIQSLQ